MKTAYRSFLNLPFRTSIRVCEDDLQSKNALTTIKVDTGSQLAESRLFKKLEKLGQITIELHYVKFESPTRPLSRRVKSPLLNVPEKALKARALSHQLT
jgi:hypothetical protein